MAASDTPHLRWHPDWHGVVVGEGEVELLVEVAVLQKMAGPKNSYQRLSHPYWQFAARLIDEFDRASNDAGQH